MRPAPQASHADPIGEAMRLAQSPDRRAGVDALRRLVARHPRDGRLRHVLGVSLLDSGCATDAVAVLAPLARSLGGASPLARVHFGNALTDAGRADEAVVLLEREVRATPTLDAWYALARAKLRAGAPADALAAYDRVLRADPLHVAAWTGASMAAFFVGDLDRAEATARRALTLAPTHADARLNLAVVLLARRAWPEAWSAYEARWATSVMAKQRLASDAPRWTGTSMSGTLLVASEQGLGDTLQGVRWLAMVRAKAARIVLVAPRALVDWLRAAHVADTVVAHGDPVPSHDAQCPLWGLPHVLGLDTDAAVIGDGRPYLPLERETPPVWPPRRIGLAWAGSATHVNDRHRSVALETLAPLSRVPGVTWVSLQADQPGALSAVWAGTRESRTCVDEPLDTSATFADTARVLGTLDLVVAIDSAVAHAAGAAGVPTWLLLPRVGLDWRWVGRETAPSWYASVRCWREGAAGKVALIAELTSALEGDVAR